MGGVGALVALGAIRVLLKVLKMKMEDGGEVRGGGRRETRRGGRRESRKGGRREEG